MESNLVFSNKYILNSYFRLIHLLICDNKKTASSITTSIRLKLINKKGLLRFYKKLLRLVNISSILNSYIIFSYCLLKRYLFTHIGWDFSIRNLAFFMYHFLAFYRAIFTMKMLFDWFPVKNWDRASPLKRFLRRATISWTRQFEDYMPSIFAWIIVINIIPIILSLIETFYLATDIKYFPLTYSFEEIVEYVLESKLRTFK